MSRSTAVSILRLIFFIAAPSYILSTEAADKKLVPKAISTSTLEAKLKGKCAVSIPPGFDWPTSPADLYKISGGIQTENLNIPGKIDTIAQRKHGWNLFAGVTQPADASPAAPPVFHTWYTVEEAFDPTDEKLSCTARNPVFRISLPTQLVMELNAPLTQELRNKGLSPSARFDINPSLLPSKDILGSNLAGDVTAFSHVAFNTEMYDYIRDNKYYLKKTLNSVIDPNVVRVNLVDPPIKGISLKFSWWPIAPNKLTPLPVWDFDPRFPGDAKNPPTTWKRIVMVDPVGGLLPPTTVKFGGFDFNSPSTVGINKFYAVRVSAADAAAANADFRIKSAARSVLGRDLEDGDYLVMTAMHIATREFDPWVWLTYWWTDKPESGPLANDMPAIVKGVWRNYVMDVSYNINNPKTENGSAPIAYNPWLELFQKGGTRSQCMACHARAAYGQGVFASFNPKDMSTTDKNGFDASPVTPNDPAFQKGTISLHRIWTIFTRAN